MGGAASGEHDAHRIIGISRSLRLFQQDRDHRTERVKLYRIVLPALIPMARGREPLTKGQFEVEYDRSQHGNPQRIAMKERQRGIDCFTWLHAGWLPELHNIGRVDPSVYHSLRRAGGSRGIENIIHWAGAMRVDWRSTVPRLEPFFD